MGIFKIINGADILEYHFLDFSAAYGFDFDSLVSHVRLEILSFVVESTAAGALSPFVSLVSIDSTSSFSVAIAALCASEIEVTLTIVTVWCADFLFHPFPLKLERIFQKNPLSFQEFATIVTTAIRRNSIPTTH